MKKLTISSLLLLAILSALVYQVLTMTMKHFRIQIQRFGNTASIPNMKPKDTPKSSTDSKLTWFIQRNTTTSSSEDKKTTRKKAIPSTHGFR